METIDKLMRDFVDQGKIPGISVCVIKVGKICWSRAYGVSDTSSGEKLTENTMFKSCSLSKVVTAYTALRLWQEEGLNLDQPLTEILPHPSLNDPDVKAITLRMILSHSSGLSHTIRDPKMEFKPGEKFSYSSGGFAYLQKVIEHLQEIPFARYVKQATLEPISMVNSSYTWPNNPKAQIAKSHDINANPLLDDQPTEETSSSSSSLFSTPNDLALFILHVFKNTEVCELMMEPQIPVTPQLSWGLGWSIEHDSKSGDWGWQWGWSKTGFRHYMSVNPTEQSGIVIFTNGVRGYEVWQEIARKTVGGFHKSIDWVLKDL